MLAIVPGFTLFINYNIFGAQYFGDGKLFLSATLVTGLGFCLDFIACGWIAIFLKNRFPSERQLMKRLATMIGLFLVITALFLYSLYGAYESFLFLNYSVNEVGFLWSYFSMGIINIFLTFLMEGIERYQSWKINWEKTEQLKKAYLESQLQSLKSQVNHHFLFDGLDALSILIRKDGEEAENLLDEMSKVYRYLLRIDDEPLVSLETELKFIESYLHMLNAQHRNNLQLSLNIAREDKTRLLPHLSLQVLFDGILLPGENSPGKAVRICIDSTGEDRVAISFNAPGRDKMVTGNESVLNNLVNNYNLISDSPVAFDYSPGKMTVYLPLLSKLAKEEEMI